MGYEGTIWHLFSLVWWGSSNAKKVCLWAAFIKIRDILLFLSTHMMMVPSGWLLARAENNHWHWLQYYMIIILFRVSTVIYGRIPNSHTVRLLPRTNWKGLANIGQNVDYMSSNYLGHYNNVTPHTFIILQLLSFSLLTISMRENWKAFSIVLFRYNSSYYA